MKTTYSKYVIEADSFDNKHGLLYNTKNDYFIRYLKQDFFDRDDLLNYPTITKFLNEKKFFIEKNEIMDMMYHHIEITKSNSTLMLILKITKNCNFRCIYCYEELYDKGKNMSIAIQKSIIKFIEKKLRRESIKHLIISWFGGEPSLNMDCICNMSKKIIKICKENNVKYSSSIVTNGFLLNIATIKNLIISGINTFQITIDGPKKIHNSQRRSVSNTDTYSTIRNNLFYLKNTKGQFQVILRTNLSKKLLQNMDEYIDDMLPLFEDKRFFAMYHPVVDFHDLSHDVTDIDVLNEMLYALKKGIRMPAVSQYLSAYYKHCYADKENHYVVDIDGKLSKCTETNEKYSFIGQLSRDGEILSNEFTNIWKSAKLSNKCVLCDNFSICGGGECPLYYLKHGESRCMKYKQLQEKKTLLRIADLQESYHLTLRKSHHEITKA